MEVRPLSSLPFHSLLVIADLLSLLYHGRFWHVSLHCEQQVLTSALGPSWRSNFLSFEPIPFAAASIGQVHRAVLDPAALSSSSLSLQADSTAANALNRTEDGGIKVAVKVQFPNIRRSVESDLGYVKALLTAGSVLPKGLFLERTIKVGWFCL